MVKYDVMIEQSDIAASYFRARLCIKKKKRVRERGGEKNSEPSLGMVPGRRPNVFRDGDLLQDSNFASFLSFWELL